MNPPNMPPAITIGDAVQTPHGFTGLVVQRSANFWTCIGDRELGTWWLGQQVLPYTEQQVEAEEWFTIHCFGGGSVLECYSRLTLISRTHLVVKPEDIQA